MKTLPIGPFSQIRSHMIMWNRMSAREYVLTRNIPRHKDITLHDIRNRFGKRAVEMMERGPLQDFSGYM